MKRSRLGFLLTAASVMSFTMLATAQSDNAAVRALYDASATVRTNIEGIRTFNSPPANFNPVTASDEQLATYGFPPRPDQATDPSGLAKWNKAMSTPARRWNGELRPRQFQNQPMMEAKVPSGVQLTPSVSHVASTGESYNWSAIVNTNTLKKYSTTASFYYVFSEFNVPVAQQAFNGSGGNVCDGYWDIASIWNGIDGFNNGDVLQGGVDSAYYCNGTTKEPFYQTWIEWYPAGSVAEYAVNPGDDIFLETWNTSSTQGYVWIEDLTKQISATYGLTAPSGTLLVGNSAEFVVERPGGDPYTSRGLYPLANYIASFWDYSGDYTHSSHLNYPGSTAPTTYVLSMINDAATQVISVPNGITPEDYGQGLTGAGFAGKFSIFFQNENCSYSGGC